MPFTVCWVNDIYFDIGTSQICSTLISSYKHKRIGPFSLTVKYRGISNRFFVAGIFNVDTLKRISKYREWSQPENSRVILRFFYLREWPLASFVMWIRWLVKYREVISHVIFDTSCRGVIWESTTLIVGYVCVLDHSSNSVMRRNVSSSCRRTKYLKV